jgi:hypothetical protein
MPRAGGGGGGLRGLGVEKILCRLLIDAPGGQKPFYKKVSGLPKIFS